MEIIVRIYFNNVRKEKNMEPKTLEYNGESIVYFSRGELIMSICVIIILFIVLFLLSWIINHFKLKKPKKNIFKVAIIIWAIIFIINLFSTLINIPIVIGINVAPSLDGGINGKYVSLGYAIELEGHNILGNSNYNVYFTSIFK